MMAITPSDCLACRHLRLDDAGRFCCAAFSHGIPTALLEGRINHREPYPGDNGVRFDPDPEAPAEVISDLLAVA